MNKISGGTGTIQTMNFGDNGRHLANQEYNICMRQEVDMCSIAYEPCHENAFKISPNSYSSVDPIEYGSGDGIQLIQSSEADICGDRIIVPCESDEFIMVSLSNQHNTGYIHISNISIIHDFKILT